MAKIRIELTERQLADLVYLIEEGLDEVTARPGREGDYAEEDMLELDRLSGVGITDIRNAIDQRIYHWEAPLVAGISLDIPPSVVNAFNQATDRDATIQAWLHAPASVHQQQSSWDEADFQAVDELLEDAGYEDIDEMDSRDKRIAILKLACEAIGHQQDEVAASLQ